MKVMTIVGTRPEIIRLSATITRLDANVDHILVHTGQNYDYELNEIFFRDLSLRKPDYFLAIDTRTVGTALGDILRKTEEVMLTERPDAVLILGDTNSSISAIMARRLQIPIYHMEAGNRCFDLNVPEEINRRIVDHISDFNLVYSEHARRHLLTEGLPHRRIYLTGSPMREVLEAHADDIDHSTIHDELGVSPGKYFIVSMHRQENVDNPGHLSSLLSALQRLQREFQIPAIVSTHPRTRDRIKKLSKETVPKDMHFHRPFGFHDYNALQKHSFCAISDSGTISEEAAILNFPAVTIRNAMERPEAMDTGTIVITGLDSDTIRNCVRSVVKQHKVGESAPIPADYQIRNVSQRVLNLILGTAKLSNRWSGIDPTV